MESNCQYWIDTSLYDLEVARSLLAKKHYLYVAFMCHQSIEKMLKAIYVNKQNLFPSKIHNLVRLSEMADIRPKMSEEQMLFLAEIDPMNIEARYPSYKNNVRNIISRKEAKRILKMSKELVTWLKSQVN